MEKLFAGTPHTKFIAAASAVILTIAIATSARGVQLQAGRVTQVVNDVKLRGKEAPRPVALGDLIRHGAPVSTGTQSRSELTFNDLTITRLGANTTFSFKEGTREMNLIDGAILFQVPKGSGGATIRTVGVTAAITGTTGIGEFHPATARNPHLFSKWLCLEGTFHLYLANGQSVELGPGEMVTTDGISFSTVLTFDIARLVSTSLFFTGYDRPLPSLDLIMLESQKQLASMLFAPPTTNPLDPARIIDVISQAIVAEEAQTSPSESPTPSEFGTPSVITSPVPYLITNGTVVTTDPSITTNGVTDFGKIYRGPVDDGAFSLWAFGSTSAVDTALDFDTNFENAGHFPLAAFKFTSLVLAGNPTIDLTNGLTNLALISVGDIISGLPGGTLTFSGLDALVLASQDGSINLGSEIAFQGIPTLFFYARGTNGDLTVASPILGTTDLFLYAGRNITFNAGTDLILGGQFSTRSAGGNISVSESGNIAIGGSLAAASDVIADAANGGNITFATGGSFSASDVVVETTVEPGVTLTDGANITFDIGTSLTVNGGSLSLTINDSNGGTIGTGGNITLNTGANLTINGGGALTLDVLNNNGGHIGTGGNISVTTGGDLTAGSIDALIDNSNGGTIGGSANLAFNLSGQLATQGDTSFTINNSNGGMIGSDAVINVTAANISTGGALNAAIINSSGGSGGNIAGSANINYNLTGDLITQGNAFLTILNDPGTIGSHATINVTANNVSTGTLNAAIDNSSGGTIGGVANLIFDLTGDLTTTSGDASFRIDNANRNGISGGSINGDAIIAIGLGGDISAQGTGLFAISNDDAGSGNGGGTILSNAIINVNAANISTGGPLSATIDNFDGGTVGGTIGGNATINVTAANITANSLLAQIDNSNGGSIGSSANVTLNVGGNLTTQGDATFQILNFDDGSGNGPGTIGVDAVINVAANNISTGGALEAGIINASQLGGTIGGNATVNVTAANVTTGGIFDSRILTFSGASIGGDAAINVTANTLSVGNLNAEINNAFGTIGGSANVNFNLTGDLTTRGNATLRIVNSDTFGGPGTIGSNATVNVTANNISTGGALSANIINFGGGAIGGNATINLTAAANITAGGLLAQIDNTAGSIGGDVAINMNVSGSATVTNDATVAISGNDPAGSAAININGSYDVGGTFLSRIDGNGTLTFNNAAAHADVLKAGVFGANGVLNVGGGGLSADTTLKLYAPGSNGQLNFVSDVTLGGNGAKILAANSVTIINGVMVTIGGPNPADVFVNFVSGVPNANYTGSDGNGTTTGTFAGAGANSPEPLSSAPPFDPASPAPIPTRTRIHPRPPVTTGVINVSSSDELLALLDDVHPGRDGRVSIPDSNRGNHGRNASRFNTAANLNAARRAEQIRTASSFSRRRLPQ